MSDDVKCGVHSGRSANDRVDYTMEMSLRLREKILHYQQIQQEKQQEDDPHVYAPPKPKVIHIGDPVTLKHKNQTLFGTVVNIALNMFGEKVYHISYTYHEVYWNGKKVARSGTARLTEEYIKKDLSRYIKKKPSKMTSEREETMEKERKKEPAKPVPTYRYVPPKPENVTPYSEIKQALINLKAKKLAAPPARAARAPAYQPAFSSYVPATPSYVPPRVSYVPSSSSSYLSSRPTSYQPPKASSSVAARAAPSLPSPAPPPPEPEYQHLLSKLDDIIAMLHKQSEAPHHPAGDPSSPPGYPSTLPETVAPGDGETDNFVHRETSNFVQREDDSGYSIFEIDTLPALKNVYRDEQPFPLKDPPRVDQLYIQKIEKEKKEDTPFYLDSIDTLPFVGPKEIRMDHFQLDDGNKRGEIYFDPSEVPPPGSFYMTEEDVSLRDLQFCCDLLDELEELYFTENAFPAVPEAEFMVDLPQEEPPKLKKVIKIELSEKPSLPAKQLQQHKDPEPAPSIVIKSEVPQVQEKKPDPPPKLPPKKPPVVQPEWTTVQKRGKRRQFT